MPLLISPNEATSIIDGDNVTEAPGIGVKVLLVAGALYNCAVIVIVVPKIFNAPVLLKNAEIDVIVPALGTENANSITGLSMVPVKSIVPFKILIPEAELPNPRRLAFPTSPPAIVVMIIGPPEANGMIAPPPGVP